MKLHFNIIQILLIASLVLSCGSQTTKYKKMEFNYFEITVPKHWNKIKLRGIDSYIGAIQMDDKEKIHFDYGRFSNDLSDLEKDNVVMYENISGRKAKIIHSKNKHSDNNTVGVYFEEVKYKNSKKIVFEMNGNNISIKNKQELLKAFRTLHFK